MSTSTPQGASNIHRITAGADNAGQRVDRFLAVHLPDISRARVKALVEAGQLRRDGLPVEQPSEPVRAGATYAIDVPPPRPAVPAPEAIPLAILYEDADLIVLDKPAGLVVHPAPGNPAGTLVNALLAHCGPEGLPGIGGERRPGIVHRLDRETSGVMVVAKTATALATLSAAFAARDLDRAYLALVWGLPNPAQGEIAGSIGRDPRDRKRMAVVALGKPALTRYTTLAQRETAVALLECRLATGRTHQIRVHLASHGHPVVGDPVYLRRIPAAARSLPDPPRGVLLDFPRQALHAARLGFTHPRTGTAMSFSTPPPQDMQALIAAAGLTSASIRTG